MPDPRFPRCFLSIGLGPDEKKVLDWFRDLLVALDFEPVTGDSLEPRPPPEKIRDMITRSDCVVVVGTRRERLEGKDAWTAPVWVQNELGIAFGASKKIALFLEERVQAGGLGSGATTYARFDREELGYSSARVVRYLWNLRSSVVLIQASESDIATMRALADELFNACVALIESKEAWSPQWFYLAHLTARATGRFFLLPEDVQEQIESAYTALRQASEAAAKLRSAKLTSANPVTSGTATPDKGLETQFGKTMQDALKFGVGVAFRLTRSCNPADWDQRMESLRGTALAPLSGFLDTIAKTGRVPENWP